LVLPVTLMLQWTGALPVPVRRTVAPGGTAVRSPQACAYCVMTAVSGPMSVTAPGLVEVIEIR
jgi:hypothetical protein